MKSIRLTFSAADEPAFLAAVSRFNDESGYLKEVKLKKFKLHHVAYVPLDEAPLFFSFFLIDEVGNFTKRRVKVEIEDQLKKLAKENPDSIRVSSALDCLQKYLLKTPPLRDLG